MKVDQDLFECDERDAMAHCVSRDLEMGAGIALQFRDAFNNVEFLKKQEKKVGEVAVLPAGESFIYYLVTKEEFHDKPSYAALASSVQAMRDHCISNDVNSLAMPRIGCGLDGLEWKEVTAILKTVFINTGIKIKIYTPPEYTHKEEDLQLTQLAECPEIWEAACSSVHVESAVYDRQSHIEKLEIKREQDQDEIVSCIKTEVKAGRQLTRRQKERFLQDHEYKAMQKESKKLIVINDILYREAEILGQTYRQVVIPKSLRRQVLHLAHQEHGHQGADRTFYTLRLRAFWPGMMKDIENHCRSCERCQVAKEAGTKSHCPMGGIIATRPLEVVAIDFTLMEAARDGRENVLVLTDVFTKYSVAVATRDQKASTVARVIIQDWIQRLGIPLRIHSDQAKNFASQVVAAVCEVYGFAKSRTTAYHAAGNGQCERFNRTLHNLLKVLSKEKKERWTEYLSEATHIYNCTPHSSTGFSPFYLLFGREPNLPIDIALDIQSEEWRRIMPTQWLAEHLNRLKAAHKIAGETMKKKMEKRQLKHNKGKLEPDIKEGDTILRRRRLHGRNKIQDSFGERVWIVEKAPGEDGGYYMIRPWEGGDTVSVTRSEIRRFYPNQDPLGAPEAIQRAEENTEVNDIGEEHRGVIVQRSRNRQIPRLLVKEPQSPRNLRPRTRQLTRSSVRQHIPPPQRTPGSPPRRMRTPQQPPPPRTGQPNSPRSPPRRPPPGVIQPNSPGPPPQPPVVQPNTPGPPPRPTPPHQPDPDPRKRPQDLATEQQRLEIPGNMRPSPSRIPVPRRSGRERRPPDRYSPS